MTRYLRISITFLDNLYHGKLNGRQPEWPPSPYRLFQALLAGSRTGCRIQQWSDTTSEAFRWLERQQPIIITPPAFPATPYTMFVPNNDSDKKPNRQDRLTSKEVYPYRMIDNTTLYYAWELQNTDLGHAQLLCQQARYLISLGWGIDTAVGDGGIISEDEFTQLPGKRWKACPVYRKPHENRLRVPIESTLDDLEQVYQSFINSIDGKTYHPPLKPRAFKSISYMPTSQMQLRPYIGFELRNQQDNWVPFDPEKANCVAAMLRYQTCCAAQDDSYQFPHGSESFVAGHVENKNDNPLRFSYLVLPTLGHPHADGLIRRVIIAEPYGAEGKHVRWAEQRLRSRKLINNQQQTQANLILASNHDRVFQHYLAPTYQWFSVTPVILPGFDDGKHIKAERLFAKSLGQTGISLDAVQEFTLRKAPYWSGAQHPKCYHKPDYLRHSPAWYVSIRFREPINGPLAIGAGRHCGLGIFAGIKE